MPLRRLSVAVLVAFGGFSIYAGTAAALDLSPPKKSGISLAVNVGSVSVTADVSAPTSADVGSAAVSVTTPAASATVDTALVTAASPDAVAAVTEAPASSPTSTPVGQSGDHSASSAKPKPSRVTSAKSSKQARPKKSAQKRLALVASKLLDVRLHVRTPLATASAGLTAGSTGVTATAATTARAVRAPVRVKTGNGLVRASLKLSKPSAKATDGPGAGAQSPAGHALFSSTPPSLLGGRVPSSGPAGHPQDLAPVVATIRGLGQPAASSLALPSSFAGAPELAPGLVGLSSVNSGPASGDSPATKGAAPALAPLVSRPPSAPAEPRAPFGLSGGAGAGIGIGFAATLFAALSAFFLLVVPRGGRRLRPVVGLARSPAFAFLLERPG